MPVITTKEDLRIQLSNLPKNSSLALVPTMGALHSGHASLIKKAVKENDQVVVSIFVNPTQFDNTEDLEKYPNSFQSDKTLITKISKEIIVFAPAASEIYDDKIESKTYNFEGLDTVMEGAFRANHFNGVGTIVEFLLRLIKPIKAYFGEKDYQQLQIIKKLVSQKKLPITIIGCPIVREKSGLAMSSRNERLSDELRDKAAIIYKILQTARAEFGMKSAQQLTEEAVKKFEKHPDFTLEYFQIADANTLTPIEKKHSKTKYRAFVAVYAGNIRLIDNIALN